MRTIIQRACLRFPRLASHSSESNRSPRRSKLGQQFSEREGPRKVFVIFGGDTSERQVSLMSGTNVWLNLQVSGDVSFLLRKKFVFKGNGSNGLKGFSSVKLPKLLYNMAKLYLL